MLYQGLLLITLFAAAVQISRTDRASSDHRAYRALCITAAAVVASACLIPILQRSGIALVIPTAAAGQLASALLLPLLFLNLKQFTNLALPQWSALRAFVIGVPLLLGFSDAAAILNQASQSAGASTGLPPSVPVAWTFAALCLLAGTWRFVSTPRGRSTITALMAGTVALVVADILGRLGGVQWLGLAPQIWLIATVFCVLAIRGPGEGNGSVRLVSRSSLMDQVQDAMLVLDREQRVLDYNQAAAVYLSSTGSELVGARAALHLPPELVSEMAAEAPQNVTLNWPVSGEPRWLEVQIKPLVVDGRQDGQLLTLRNVTRRYLAEQALQQSQEALQEANIQLEALANTDPLTQLYNRRYFMEQFTLEMERHARSGLTLGLLILDLDHFKQINDTHGHPMGDAVLKKASASLQAGIRDADVVARIGGEEFAVLVVDATMDGPRILAERLCEGIRQLEILSESGARIPVSTSIGCLRFRGGMVDAATLFALADQALYRAKESGRDRVEVANYRPLPRPRHFSGQRGELPELEVDAPASVHKR